MDFTHGTSRTEVGNIRSQPHEHSKEGISLTMKLCRTVLM